MVQNVTFVCSHLSVFGQCFGQQELKICVFFFVLFCAILIIIIWRRYEKMTFTKFAYNVHLPVYS